MRQSLKIALSLLVSILIFSVFAVLAFSGLFELLETGFFQPRIKKEFNRQLMLIAERTEGYHRDNFERFMPVVEKSYVAAAFLAQQSQEDISNRINTFGRLQEDYAWLRIVRFLDPDGDKIHFSTLPGDIRIKDKYSIVYHKLSEVESGISGDKLIAGQGEAPRLIIGSEEFIYSFPVVDRYEIYRGSALFYISKSALSTLLFSVADLEFRKLLLIQNQGLLINYSGELSLITEVVKSQWQADTAEIISEAIVLDNPEGEQEKYLHSAIRTEDYGFIGIFTPFSAIELHPAMKIILLAAFFLTTFLIIFLIFNLKQDPIVVMRNRIKRFQIGVLQEFIQGKEEISWPLNHEALAKPLGRRPCTKVLNCC